MTWLALWFALEIGIIPESGEHIWNDDVMIEDIQEEASIFTDFEAEIEIYDIIFVGGGIYLHAWLRNPDLVFMPDEIIPRVFGGLRYGIISLKILRYCSHAVSSHYALKFPVSEKYSTSISLIVSNRLRRQH